MKLDIKTLITIITFAATMGGFYYSTQIRLDYLEDKVTVIEKQIKQIKKTKSVGLTKTPRRCCRTIIVGG